MTQYDFQTQAHAKWILAGEHAVLRGNPALVFPFGFSIIPFNLTSSSTSLVVPLMVKSPINLYFLSPTFLEPIVVCARV